MYKNGTGINIDKISETPGDYKQGVEICVNNIELDTDTVKNAINKLIFFDNLIIHANNIQGRLKSYISDFNDKQIERFNNLSCSDYHYIDSGIYAKVGNVLYEIDKNVVSHKLFEGYGNFMAIECPIGSVNVTPNREQLQYTDKTIKKLKEVLDKAYDELSKMAMKQALQNFKTINDAYNFYANSSNLKLASRISFNVPTLLDFSDLIVNGGKIPEYVWPIIQMIRYDDIPEHIVADIYNKTYRMVKSRINLVKLLEYQLALKCDDRIKQVTKSYYCNEYENVAIVIKRTDISDLLRYIITRSTRRNIRTKTEALKALSFIIKNYKYYELKNDNVPQSYISTFKAVTTRKKPAEKIDIRKYIRYEGYTIYSLSSYLNYYLFESNSKKKLRRGSPHLIVYSPNTKDDKLIKQLCADFHDKKIEFITLKKENIPALPKSRLFISLEDFLTLQQKIITKAATAKYLLKKYDDYYKIMLSDSKDKFNDYIYHYNVYSDNEEVQKLLKQYEERKWLDWAAIIKFSLSEDDMKRLMQKKTLQELDNITDSLLYLIKGRYSKDESFGIEPDKKTILLLTKLLRK